MSLPLREWPERLAATLHNDCRLFHEVRVLAETASTQDVARDHASRIGLVVIAWRQHSGRGRMGRTWVDTAEDGVAATFVAPDSSPERLAVASAIAVARTIEPFLGRPVSIKWPNDIVVGRKKIAGILVERTGNAALIGIGINVGQTSMPEELDATATSMRMLGADVGRLRVLEVLFGQLDGALLEELELLALEYARRDALRGTVARFGTPEGEIEGLVVRVNPFEGLVVRIDGQERRLPPATTTVVSWKDP